MVATVHHHENDDLWGLAVCLAGGTIALAGVIALVHIPGVQAFLNDSASLIWQQVQGTFRVPRP